MLNEQELITLALKLEAPQVIGNVLDGNEKLDDAGHYALHDMISNLQPDSALIAIAFGTKRVASVYKEASPSMKILDMEASRIIRDYGSLWLDNAQGHDLNEDDLLETLEGSVEDLENIAELLEFNASFLKAKDEAAYIVCDILITQARAHALVAEAYFDAVKEAQKNDFAQEPAFTDNVIAFPSGAQLRA